MPTQEIQSTDWATFCKRFEQLHNGQLMTIFQINTAGQRTEVARDMPLQSMKFGKGDCNDHMFITLFQEGKREITHEVVEPIHVKIREEGEGSKGLQIDGENGSTILRFSSGKIDQLLEGLETA
jgi:hypothetical protein